jgi:hypothetical protein
MNAFCTIVTPDHMDRALALLQSLREHTKPVPFFVLATNSVSYEPEGVQVVSLDTLCAEDETARQVCTKYGNSTDKARWSLKPVFTTFILRKYSAVSQVLYLDCDVCFFDSADVLFSQLASGGVLLTPHWRPIDPGPSLSTFRLNFQDGLFNAGCVGINSRGVDAMKWWARACLSECIVDREQGLFVDQRYLDILPIYFPDTVICRHQGCNVAAWNMHLRRCTINGHVLINDIWPLVFLHFTRSTIERIERSKDDALYQALQHHKALIKSASEVLNAYDINRDCVSDKLATGEKHATTDAVRTLSNRSA